MDYIELKKIDTYPKEYIEYVNMYKDKIYELMEVNINLLNFDNIYLKEMKNILDKYDILALHATRLYRKENIYKKGILVPELNEGLIDYIIEPLKDVVKEDIYTKIYLKLKEERLENYSSVHFIIGSEDDVYIENNFLMLEHYGGEFLQNILGWLEIKDEIKEKISKIGSKCVIKFRYNFLEMEDLLAVRIIFNMCKNILEIYNKEIFIETYTFDNIDASKIIDIIEI